MSAHPKADVSVRDLAQEGVTAKQKRDVAQTATPVGPLPPTGNDARISRDQSATDFISESLADLDSRDLAIRRTGRIHMLSWLTLGVAIATFLFVAALAKWSNDRAVQIDAQIKVLLANIELWRLTGIKTGAISIEEWKADFSSADAMCSSSNPESPCGLARVTGPGPDRTLKASLDDASAGPAIVLIVGGHDREPLSERARERFGTNIQLAQSRAVAIRLEIERMAEHLQTPPLRIISLPRAASELDHENADDRAVSVSVIRVGGR
jgi:hypothetical protein